MSYTNQGLNTPTPFDPAQANVWAATVNTNMTLLDNATGGILTLTVNTSNVILTSSNGTPDQARNAHYIVGGTLTGNRSIFLPLSRTQMMSVYNGTSATASNFTLTIAVNNGSGAAAGSTVSVPTGYAYSLASDGSNISLRTPPLLSTSGFLVAASNLSDVSSSVAALSNINGATKGANSNITSLTGLTTPLSIAQGGTSASSAAAAYAALGGGTMGQRALFVQSGGSPSGGSSGDVFFVY